MPQNNYPKLHNSMWPGLVGKKSMGGAEPDLALDTMLDPLEPATKANVERAMKDHILERAQLIGTYQKHARAKKSA